MSGCLILTKLLRDVYKQLTFLLTTDDGLGFNGLAAADLDFRKEE